MIKKVRQHLMNSSLTFLFRRAWWGTSRNKSLDLILLWLSLVSFSHFDIIVHHTVVYVLLTRTNPQRTTQLEYYQVLYLNSKMELNNIIFTIGLYITHNEMGNWHC